jgi:hypothetical protein
MNLNTEKIIGLAAVLLKRLSLLFVLFLVPSLTFAQNDGNSGLDFDDNPNLHLGVKAGVGFSNIVSSELSTSRVRPGMAVGLYGNYLIKKKILIQLEMNGNLRGAKFKFDKAASLNRLSLFYLDVPLIVHYKINKNAKLLPFAGGQASLIFRKDAYKSDEQVPQPANIDIKKYDLALTAGILYQMHPKVGLQLQLNFGMLNINNRLTLPFYPYLGNGDPIYNRNLQLCLVF